MQWYSSVTYYLPFYDSIREHHTCKRKKNDNHNSLEQVWHSFEPIDIYKLITFDNQNEEDNGEKIVLRHSCKNLLYYFQQNTGS